MGDVVEMEIPPDKGYLDVVRMVVTTAAQTDPLFPDRRVPDLRLAVSEAFTNAVEAQQREGTTEPIVIRCDVGDDRVEVEVVDHGGGFDPETVATLPSVTDPARLDHERGLGLSLIRSLTDTAEFTSEGDGTRVHLVVRRNGRSGDVARDG